jgi:hypothetical protein
VAEFLGEDIAQVVADELGPIVLAATLTVITQGSRTDGQLTAGPAQTTANYTARGWWEDYAVNQIDGDLVRVGDRRAVLLGATIEGGIVPGPGMQVTIEGTTATVIRLERRDPAAATYQLQCGVR